jgi:hypothetical protein
MQYSTVISEKEMPGSTDSSDHSRGSKSRSSKSVDLASSGSRENKCQVTWDGTDAQTVDERTSAFVGGNTILAGHNKRKSPFPRHSCTRSKPSHRNAENSTGKDIDESYHAILFEFPTNIPLFDIGRLD